MEHGEEDGALDRELEAPAGEQDRQSRSKTDAGPILAL